MATVKEVVGVTELFHGETRHDIKVNKDFSRFGAISISLGCHAVSPTSHRRDCRKLDQFSPSMSNDLGPESLTKGNLVMIREQPSIEEDCTISTRGLAGARK